MLIDYSTWTLLFIFFTFLVIFAQLLMELMCKIWHQASSFINIDNFISHAFWAKWNKDSFNLCYVIQGSIIKIFICYILSFKYICVFY